MERITEEQITTAENEARAIHGILCDAISRLAENTNIGNEAYRMLNASLTMQMKFYNDDAAAMRRAWEAKQDSEQE